MGSVEEAVRELFRRDAIRRGSTEFYDRSSAMRFIDACQEMGLLVLGVEGFELTPGRTMPRLDAIADFSDLVSVGQPDPSARSADEARSFIERMGADVEFFDVVIADPRRPTGDR